MRAGEGERGSNSISEICTKPVHIKPGIKAKISKGLGHIVLEAKEELVSLVSVSGGTLNYCARLDCAETSKTMSVVCGNGEAGGADN